MNNLNNKTTKKISDLLVYIAIFTSVLSQIPNMNAFRIIMYIAWSITLFFLFISKGGRIRISKFSKIYFVVYLLYLIYCLSIGIINKNYLLSNYLRVLLIPLLVTIVTDLYYDEKGNSINKIKIIYIIASLLFAVWVQGTYFTSYTNWLNQYEYSFAQKNSAAQIWASALLLLVFGVKYSNIWQRLIGYSIAMYLLIMISICQCRTALLGLATIVVLFAVIKSKKKILLILSILIICITLINIPFIKSFINQALFLTKYAGTDANTFSSGRIDLYLKAINNFMDSPIIGVGKYYVDCSYILILTESGIIGFLLVQTIWFNKLKKNIKLIKTSKQSNFIFAITIFYIIESFLEGFPPFGPGVSSFIFWFMSEYYTNMEIVERKNINE